MDQIAPLTSAGQVTGAVALADVQGAVFGAVGVQPGRLVLGAATGGGQARRVVAVPLVVGLDGVLAGGRGAHGIVVNRK